MRYCLVLVVVGSCLGCVSRAGPFITNISKSDAGVLVIEKCFAEFNSFLGSASNGDCLNQTLHLTEGK